jgi:hypothetical protein
MVHMKMEPWIKNILSMIVIVLVGFVLFNLAFLMAFGIITLIMTVTGASSGSPPSTVAFAILLLILWTIAWFIFRSKINDLSKATFLTMPLMSTLVVLYVVTYGLSQWVAITIGSILCVAILYFIRLKKLSWLYIFATFYVLVLIAFIRIFDIQI